MKYEWLESYCLALPGAMTDFKVEWNATRYMVGGKMFVMAGGDKEEQPIISLRLDPMRGDALRRMYPGEVVPGYYMNKLHWNSVYRSGNVSDDEVKSMVTESYQLIFAGLTKKARREILMGANA